jgi:hypothetical protein
MNSESSGSNRNQFITAKQRMPSPHLISVKLRNFRAAQYKFMLA